MSDDTIQIKAFNEIGPEPKGNNNYSEFGAMTVNKSLGGTVIESSGVLELLDFNKPLIRFDFEETVPMATNQVVALRSKQRLIAQDIDIRGVTCTESMVNKGAFGRKLHLQIFFCSKNPC